jgi:hypothetical protein
MPRMILLDEFHLGLRAPKDLPDAEYQAIRRVLNDRRFQAELRRAVREVSSRHPDLARVRVTLSR